MYVQKLRIRRCRRKIQLFIYSCLVLFFSDRSPAIDAPPECSTEHAYGASGHLRLPKGCNPRSLLLYILATYKATITTTTANASEIVSSDTSSVRTCSSDRSICLRFYLCVLVFGCLVSPFGTAHVFRGKFSLGFGVGYFFAVIERLALRRYDAVLFMGCSACMFSSTDLQQ